MMTKARRREIEQEAERQASFYTDNLPPSSGLTPALRGDDPFWSKVDKAIEEAKDRHD